MKNKRIIVIGGGPSGLLSAIYAKSNNNDVTIIERNKECGKKILLTGNGRCNYTNDDFNISYYNSTNKDILNSIITKNNHQEIITFFNSLGIIPKIKNGYYYPNSLNSSSIRNVLLLKVKEKNIKVINDVLVKDIKVKDDIFIINDKFKADELVIATGGMSYSKTGSDGLGYQLLTNLGHSIIKPLPALVSLNTNINVSDWYGVRCDAKVSLYEDNILISEEQGEIQLTKTGISGICVFNISSKISRGLDSNKKEVVKIDFLPLLNLTTKEFLKYIDERNKSLSKRNLTNLFEGVLNNKLINTILNILKINNKKTWDELTIKEKNDFARLIKEFPFEVLSVGDFSLSQVTSGGIPLKEINIKTMESLKVKNLYITGEVLDVDGKCGGYNLTFAFISGMLAGKSIKEKE